MPDTVEKGKVLYREQTSEVLGLMGLREAPAIPTSSTHPIFLFPLCKPDSFLPQGKFVLSEWTMAFSIQAYLVLLHFADISFFTN